MSAKTGQLHLASAGSNGDSEPPIRYVVRPDFSIAKAFAANWFGIVFSQAAFELYDDVESTLAQVSRVAKPGATLIAGIDMQPHSRWLRDKDPLKSYQRGPSAYMFLRFSGVPNRVQTSEYDRLRTQHGWANIDMKVLFAVDTDKFPASGQALSGRTASTRRVTYR